MKRINIFYLVLLLSLFLSVIISSLLSIDIKKSFFGGSIILGYAWVTCACASYLSKEKMQSLHAILYYSLIISFFIQIYSISGLIDNPWQRATIPVITLKDFSWFIPPGDIKTDPNVLAFGVVLSYFYLSATIKSIPKKIILLVIVVSTLIMTESRSAFIGFVSCIIFYLFYLCKVRNGIIKTLLYLAYIMMLLCVCFFIIYICSVYLDGIYIPNILSRLFTIGNDLSSNSRLHSIYISIDLIKESSFLNLIFGHGMDHILYYTDPHNIFIATLYNQGVIGLIILILFFILMCHFSMKSGEDSILSLTIVLFLFIISNLYWQTKILWVGFLFIMTLYYRNKCKCTHL